MNGLNQYFNNWIDSIKWAYKTNPIYKEKIDYYQERLNSCKTQVFDTIGGVESFENKEENRLIELLDNLNRYKKKYEDNLLLIAQANDFINKYLTNREKQFCIKFVSKNLSKTQIAKVENYSRSYVSKVFKQIERKFWVNVVCNGT